MLLSLKIENFALIDQLDLTFGAGLNVLTGETGAGKSIILDAIDAVLGGKTSGRSVRTGEERALIEGQFQLRPELQAWLSQEGIDPAQGAVLVCTREIFASGSARNKSRVNGVTVNRQQMERLRELLVEITAQGQTVQIGQAGVQRDWLDSFGGEKLLRQRERVGEKFVAYQQAARTLEQRQQMEAQRLQQLDLFEYQLKELNVANLSDPNELEELENERNRLSHSVELQQQSYLIYQMLYQNETGGEALACADLLGQAEQRLLDMVEYDNQLQPILDLVANALAQVEQAGREINLYGENIEADPRRLQEVQERIVELKAICRKYGPTLADAIALQENLQAEMDILTGGGQSLADLEAIAQARKAELVEACGKLTKLRQAAAETLETQLVAELKPLAMEKVKFQVGIAPIAATPAGADRITYLISPNPGEPLQPLTEIASGGEMSRFLLALQSCFSQVDAVGTLVFDEIDAGVSGRVAGAIAQKLHHLSLHHQVLCVTHQPIVAAMADQHFRVSKQVIDPENTGKQAKGNNKVENLRTVVRIQSLDEGERRLELAQIASGDVVQGENGSAKAAIDFAESLLIQASNIRDGQQVEVVEAVAQTVVKQSGKPKRKANKSKVG
ncbi:DNA repair protein RecN [Alkalinema pantanalense CENA528]|uniref:DNA repair protein RecN n=1 Tax=Alkalinema pantanalense TaxID=1620705 RepID=UPI003D6E2024